MAKRIFDNEPGVIGGSTGASLMERVARPSRASRMAELRDWHAERAAGNADTKPGFVSASPSLSRKRWNAHSPWNGNLSLD